MPLTIYTDSDWANCPLTRKSKGGGVIFHGPHVIHHWCKQQQRIAKSTAEAEFISMNKGLDELFGSRNVAEWLLNKPYPLIHKFDASATKGITLRQGAGPIKYLTAADLWVQERVLTEKVQLIKIPRSINVADFLCSVPKTREQFKWAMSNMNLVHLDGNPLMSLQAGSKRGKRMMRVDPA